MEKNQQPVDTYPKGEQEQIHHLTKQSSQNQYDRSQEENSPQSQHHPTTNSPPSYAQPAPSIVNQQPTALAPAAPSILNQQYTALSTAVPSVANQQHIELAQQPLLTYPAVAEERPENYLSLAVITCLCCCWPISLCAIINAAQVDSAYDAGDVQGAKRLSAAAKNYGLSSFIVGMFVTTFSIIYYIIRYLFF